MDYEYKCVGAPEKPRKSRRAKTRSQRVALSLEEVIRDEAVNGWEYMRTDLVPVIERAGLFSRPHEVHRAVLVFRRELATRSPVRGAGTGRRQTHAVDDDEYMPERRFRRGAASGNERGHDPLDDDHAQPRGRAIPAEEPIRLTADDMIDEAAPRRSRDRLPPSGLG